ncbi:chorismate mutase [Buchnera aphidicola]|uniref:Bifunctional chorismate mutase/prephenate dehydratase n=1 Tax=Buchnera aphidicola (Aphis aurantii) TaxID=1470492 RepID=A0AAU6W4H3_9GAMM
MLSENDLVDLRNEINNIDKKIVKLLAQRKKLVCKIAQSKIQNNQPIRDIDREKNLLSNLTNLGKKKNLNPDYITCLFELIIKESIRTQKKLLEKSKVNKKTNKTIASFLGPKGTYSHIALSQYEKQSLKKFVEKECVNFEEVIESVEKNESNYAILPIENSFSGPINEIFNILKEIKLFIIGEIYVHIDHCLLALEQVEFNIIKRIYSHPQPFKQCSNFINQFPHWKSTYTNSTADAIKKIIKYQKITNVALGSEIGNKIYGLKILRKNISNTINNITKFVVLSKKPIKIDSNKQVKTTIIFSVKNPSKEIYEIISTLKQKKIIVKILIFNNITKNQQEKIFYLDIEKNLSSNTIQNILNKIQKISQFKKILGCYPIENKKLF